ncbi:MAG: hypothetical protein IJT03_07355, partial [Clostridia bacterium]|nr:hypothetical protein [Clostridia bacterium]
MGKPDFYVERDLNPKRVSGVRKQSGGLFSAAKSEAGTVQSTVAEDAAKRKSCRVSGGIFALYYSLLSL